MGVSRCKGIQGVIYRDSGKVLSTIYLGVRGPKVAAGNLHLDSCLQGKPG